MNEAEKARQKTARAAKKVEKRRKRQIEYNKKSAIRKINRGIKRAIRKGRYAVSFEVQTIEFIRIKKAIKEHFTSKGYDVKFYKWGDFNRYTNIEIDWRCKQNEQ